MNLHSTRLRAALGAAIAVTTVAAPLAFAGGPGATGQAGAAIDSAIVGVVDTIDAS